MPSLVKLLNVVSLLPSIAVVMANLEACVMMLYLLLYINAMFVTPFFVWLYLYY